MILPGSSVSIWIYLFVLFASEVYVRKRSCFLNVGTIEEAAKADHKPANGARLARSPELDLSVESQHIITHRRKPTIQVITVTSILLDWPCLKLGEVGSGEEADGPAVSYVKTAKEAAKAAKAGRVHILASIDNKQIDISCHKYFLIGAARGAGWNVRSHCQSCGGFEIQC